MCGTIFIKLCKHRKSSFFFYYYYLFSKYVTKKKLGRIPYYSHKYLTEILSTNIVYIFLIFHKNIAYIYISTKSSYTSMMMVIYTTQKKHIYDDKKRKISSLQYMTQK